MADEARKARVAQAAVDRALEYPFKVWGFDEDICLRALLEYGRLTGDARPSEFVAGLVRPWCEAKVAPGAGQVDAAAAGGSPAPQPRPRLANADHVAPGVVILDLHEANGDDVYLQAALQLGTLYRSFPEVAGVRVHRPDLAGLSDLVWVDCLALDGPFLARLASATGEGSWRDLAIATTLAYADALLDRRAGLFRHGFDTRTRTQSDCCWARGNGWAMHGLLDTILELPSAHPGRVTLAALLERQVRALTRLQSPSGHWHTVLDDPTTPLENSAAAFFASAVLKARRNGLLGSLPGEDLDALVEAAVAALLSAVEPPGDRPPTDRAASAARATYTGAGAGYAAGQADSAPAGGLPVSYATPVGSRATYVAAPLGTFPWGQGPLLLTLIETQLAARSRTGGITA